MQFLDSEQNLNDGRLGIIRGRHLNLFFWIGMGLVSMVVGGYAIWQGFGQNGLDRAQLFVLGTLTFCWGGYLTASKFNFIRRITFLPNQIIVQYLFRKKDYAIADLRDARLLTKKTNNVLLRDVDYLELCFVGSRCVYIVAPEISVPLKAVQELLERSYALSFDMHFLGNNRPPSNQSLRKQPSEIFHSQRKNFLPILILMLPGLIAGALMVHFYLASARRPSGDIFWGFLGLGSVVFFMDVFRKMVWSITLLSDRILIRYPFHKVSIDVNLLWGVRIIPRYGQENPRQTAILQLDYSNSNRVRIYQSEMAAKLKRVMESMIKRYDFVYRLEKIQGFVGSSWLSTGSKRPFDTYLYGESSVDMDSVPAICEWLQGCEYRSDIDQFGEEDYWQTPQQFEETRSGDCEDHALWAWSKLVWLGISAEFVVGKVKFEGSDAYGGHAWVRYENNDVAVIFEATSKYRIIRLEEDVGEQYVPKYSINNDFQTFRYGRVYYKNTVAE